MNKDWLKDYEKPLLESEKEKLDEIADEIFTENWLKFITLIQKRHLPKNKKLYKKLHRRLGKFTAEEFGKNLNYFPIFYEFTLNLMVMYKVYVDDHKKKSLNPLNFKTEF
jgi:hypothetical protein